jgi:CRP-like cAMP-binding protein
VDVSTPPTRSICRNYLLAALPEADFQRIAPQLTIIPMQVRQPLYCVGDEIEYVYFPNGGMVSITAVMADGTVVETATVGREGMVGTEVCLRTNAATAWGDTMVQIPDGSALRMTAHALRAELTRRGELSDLLGRYTQSVIAQMMQTGACNALHPVHERCARWLLLAHDRVGKDAFQLSHEYLAAMLGVRRPSVSVVAGALQAAGVISYRHGHLTILDRPGLEQAACECYVRIRAHVDQFRPAEQG